MKKNIIEPIQLITGDQAVGTYTGQYLIAQCAYLVIWGERLIRMSLI